MPLSALRHLPPTWLLAPVLGAAAVLCFAPFSLFWAAPLAWLGLFLLFERSHNPRQAAVTGGLFGLGFFLAGVSWVFVSLSVFGGMPAWLAAPATFLFCAVLALYPGLSGFLYRRWRPPAFWQRSLFFAACIAGTDWLRAWLFTGFPWLALGYSQTPPSPLAGFAPVLGVFGLSFLLAWLAATLARPRLGLPLAALLALSGFGLQQIHWSEAHGPALRVALVQGNIPQEMKFDRTAFVQTLQLYRELIASHPADLTILPETALPTFVDYLPREYLDELASLARQQGGNILFGTLTGDPDGAYFNSAVSLGAAPAQVYSKQHLVPFGEFIPPGFAWFMAQAHIPMSSFSAGAVSGETLTFGSDAARYQVAVNICYEDAFGEEIIRALPAAGLLANLSNTAWFGDSLAQPQHLQIARLRALETGRPMLRATNTGMTALIDAQGQIQAQLPPFTRGVLQVEVRPHRGATPYSRSGNWGALALMLLAVVLSRIKSSRSGAALH